MALSSKPKRQWKRPLLQTVATETEQCLLACSPDTPFGCRDFGCVCVADCATCIDTLTCGPAC